MFKTFIEIFEELDLDIEANHIIVKPNVLDFLRGSAHAEWHSYIHTTVALTIVLKVLKKSGTQECGHHVVVSTAYLFAQFLNFSQIKFT
jgi:hypothetical protein